jgi:hypothetical protein
VVQHKSLAIGDLWQNAHVCHALLQLLAAADEASAGAGVPSPPSELDDFDLAAGTLLRKQEGVTLCQELSCAPIRVLPKMHAPQSGFTIRSFSHHLALITGNEIRPKWFTVGSTTATSELRLLVVPWPDKLNSSEFEPVPRGKCVMRNLPPKYGFFEFTHENGKRFAKNVVALFQHAHRTVGSIDAVVLPECATTDDEYDEINSILVSQGVFDRRCPRTAECRWLSRKLDPLQHSSGRT